MVTLAEKPATGQKINIEAINKAVVRTPRVQRLKLARLDIRTPIVSAERAKLYRESWQQTRGEHPAIRRAKAFKHFLENKELFIGADELLVGNITKHLRGTYPNPQEFPGYVAKIIKDGIDTYGESINEAIPKDDLDTILECCDYWADEYPGARIEQKVREIAGDRYAKMLQARLLTIPPSPPFVDLAGQDWDRILSIGLNGIIAEARDRIAALKKSSLTTNKVDKLHWYEAVIITLEGVITFAQRYARLAREMAAKESDNTRKAELEKIAEVCEWVPANPPRSFYEAIQFHWLLVLCLELEKSNRFQISMGRIDQYIWPYYEKDIREGRITYDEAGELLGCLLIKGMGNEYFAADFAGDVQLDMGGFSLQFTTGSYGYTYTIGGVDKRGQDASNELSVLIVEALRQVKCTFPYVHLRFHRAMAPELIDKAIECNSEGGGNPAWFSDRHGTEILLGAGLPIEEARDWCLVGCVFAIHRSSAGSGTHSGWINHAKILELAMNNGVDPVTGQRLGIATGDPRNFRTFDQMLEAYKKQYDYVLDLVVRVHNATWAIGREDALYCPLTSACVAGQLELGVDVTRGSRYPALDATTFSDRCHNDVADSLTAIKKLVFEDNKLTIDELLTAITANFEGYEDTLQMCLAAPKYGNDDDEADAMMALVWQNATDGIQQYRSADGQRFRIMRSGGSWAQWAGEIVGALPNGRKAGTTLYDASGSPMQGKDTKGFTATLNSVTKGCDPIYVDGPVLNQRLAPRALQSNEKKAKFAALLASFFDRPSCHIQFNVFDREMLLDAQKNPENYRDLIVRVAGYSAFWIELTPELQNDILSRTEQEL
ncbi:pyruvate formate lyase family protein [Chloroflexota bacterium]